MVALQVLVAMVALQVLVAMVALQVLAAMVAMVAMAAMVLRRGKAGIALCTVQRVQEVSFVYRASPIRTAKVQHCRNRRCVRNGGKDKGQLKDCLW